MNSNNYQFDYDSGNRGNKWTKEQLCGEEYSYLITQLTQISVNKSCGERDTGWPLLWTFIFLDSSVTSDAFT